jgi:hypothetical protein
MWHGKDNPPRQPKIRQRGIGRALNPPPSGETITCSSWQNCARLNGDRSAGCPPARQHVAFAEQQTLMQPGRRAVAGMEKQIHFVAIRLLYQPRGL